MIKYISNPNLPTKKVSSLVCGSLNKTVFDFFDKRNVKAFKIDEVDGVDNAISFHTDIAVLHMGDNNVILDKRQMRLARELQDYGFNIHFTKDEIKGEYPFDVKLNFAITNDYVIGNEKFADDLVEDIIGNKTLISVKQGYAKCSVLIVDEKAIVTDDISIHNKVQNFGIDSLLIEKGDVTLLGHEYGFIGGASGKISKQEVVFFGDITKHRNFNEISDFLNKYGCKLIYFKSFPLTDFGGIIPLTEK